MNHRLYTVTLADLGTYEVTVAAADPKEAAAIAKGVLFEEATQLTPGISIVKREAEARAEPAAEQPIRQFDVMGSYTVEFVIRVPAFNAEDAERHARRLYEAEPFPWEHTVGDDRVRWHSAREVQS
ncbi:MAG: hypothetical protein R3D68_07280 [Hyphomicrobiaceae bacterium]